MIKRIITFVLAFTMVASVCQAALPVPDNSEVIEFTIKSVELDEIKKSKFDCYNKEFYDIIIKYTKKGDNYEEK